MTRACIPSQTPQGRTPRLCSRRRPRPAAPQATAQGKPAGGPRRRRRRWGGIARALCGRSGWAVAAGAAGRTSLQRSADRAPPVLSHHHLLACPPVCAVRCGRGRHRQDCGTDGARVHEGSHAGGLCQRTMSAKGSLRQVPGSLRLHACSAWARLRPPAACVVLPPVCRLVSLYAGSSAALQTPGPVLPQQPPIDWIGTASRLRPLARWALSNCEMAEPRPLTPVGPAGRALSVCQPAAALAPLGLQVAPFQLAN